MLAACGCGTDKSHHTSWSYPFWIDSATVGAIAKDYDVTQTGGNGAWSEVSYDNIKLSLYSYSLTTRSLTKLATLRNDVAFILGGRGRYQYPWLGYTYSVTQTHQRVGAYNLQTHANISLPESEGDGMRVCAIGRTGRYIAYYPDDEYTTRSVVADLRTNTVVARLDTGGVPFWVDDSAGTVLLGKNTWPSDSTLVTEYNLTSAARTVVSHWPIVTIQGAIDYGNAVCASASRNSCYCPVASLHDSAPTLLPLLQSGWFSTVVDIDLRTRKYLNTDGSVYISSLDTSVETLIIAAHTQ
jgi:hypothetical protein